MAVLTYFQCPLSHFCFSSVKFVSGVYASNKNSKLGVIIEREVAKGLCSNGLTTSRKLLNLRKKYSNIKKSGKMLRKAWKGKEGRGKFRKVVN